MVHELVIIRQVSLFGLLLAAGFIVAFWKAIVAILVVALLVGIIVGAIFWWRGQVDAQMRADEETRRRADRQLAGWEEGDPRATYGYGAFDGQEQWG